MKYALLIILLLFTFTLQSQTLAYKNRICLAILEHESYFGKYLVNQNDTASKGLFQMREIYVREVNKICGYNKFKPEDRFDFKKSVAMFFIFNNYHYPNWDYKTISIVHACGHYTENKKALEYWDAIQKILEHGESKN